MDGSDEVGKVGDSVAGEVVEVVFGAGFDGNLTEALDGQVFVGGEEAVEKGSVVMILAQIFHIAQSIKFWADSIYGQKNIWVTGGCSCLSLLFQ